MSETNTKPQLLSEKTIRAVKTIQDESIKSALAVGKSPYQITLDRITRPVAKAKIEGKPSDFKRCKTACNAIAMSDGVDYAKLKNVIKQASAVLLDTPPPENKQKVTQEVTN